MQSERLETIFERDLDRLDGLAKNEWLPGPRVSRRSVTGAGLATFAAITVMVLVVALSALAVRDAQVAQPDNAPTSDRNAAQPPATSSNAASGTCGATQHPTASATCVLLAGTLVEIVGSNGLREASTPLVRVQLDSPNFSTQFGNPALFEADARTQINPKSPNIAATGVKVGAPVQVSFDPRATKTSSGAYLLTEFVVVSDGRLPDCFVELDITNPSPGPVLGSGAMNAEEAFRRTFPNVTDFKMFPGESSFNASAPVWIVAASGETYVVHILGSINAPNNWYAFPAKFVRCHTPQEIRDRQIVPGSPSDSPRPDGTRG